MVQSVQAGCPYYEEYPTEPTGVLNGFMAALFGLWELAHWAADEKARSLSQLGLASLEKMLPVYTTSWWTLYDFSEGPGPNLNSPRYQDLVINYVRVSSTLTGSAVVARHLRDWQRRNTPFNRWRATVVKSNRKLLTR